jgi:hypothetical protein
MKGNQWQAFAGAALASAKVLALALITAPAVAQTADDPKCSGKADVPWREQIAGCTDAIASRKYLGKAVERASRP